jgi:hypothetical protein
MRCCEERATQKSPSKHAEVAEIAGAIEPNEKPSPNRRKCRTGFIPKLDLLLFKISKPLSWQRNE